MLTELTYRLYFVVMRMSGQSPKLAPVLAKARGHTRLWPGRQTTPPPGPFVLPSSVRSSLQDCDEDLNQHQDNDENVHLNTP